MTIYGPEALSAIGGKFAVVSGCPEATAAAIHILEQGGNVVDAALTASAVVCVVMPQATSIGGDLFALVKHGGASSIMAVNASGAAPRAATLAAYRGRGYQRVPIAGPLSIQTPGFVAGWQAIADRWASRPAVQLLAPAIFYAESGFPVGTRLARFISEAAPQYGQHAGFRETFAAGGRSLREGDRLVQTSLARTLRTIAAEGAAGFYSGWVARDIARTVGDSGGFLKESDLAEVKAEFVEPLTIRFRDFAVSTQPPVSQGAILLRVLGLLAQEHERPREVPLARYWLSAAKGIGTAFCERLAMLGDTPDARERAQRMVDVGGNSPADDRFYAANQGPETTTLSVMDAQGNAISIIQSVFADLGCGVVARDSGVLLNNRLSAFFLDEAHPNCLRPGARTMNTLHSFMVSDRQGVRWTGGSPGGDMQPQANLQLLARLIDYGESPEDAVAAARWAVMPGTIPADIAAHSAAFIIADPELGQDVRTAFANAGLHVANDTTRNIGSEKFVGRLTSGAGVGAWCDRRRDGAVAIL